MNEQEYKAWAAKNAAMHLSWAPTWWNPLTWDNQHRFNRVVGDMYMELATAPKGTFDKDRYKCLGEVASFTMKRGYYNIDSLKACY